MSAGIHNFSKLVWLSGMDFNLLSSLTDNYFIGIEANILDSRRLYWIYKSINKRTKL